MGDEGISKLYIVKVIGSYIDVPRDINVVKIAGTLHKHARCKRIYVLFALYKVEKFAR